MSHLKRHAGGKKNPDRDVYLTNVDDIHYLVLFYLASVYPCLFFTLAYPISPCRILPYIIFHFLQHLPYIISPL